MLRTLYHVGKRAFDKGYRLCNQISASDEHYDQEFLGSFWESKESGETLSRKLSAA